MLIPKRAAGSPDDHPAWLQIAGLSAIGSLAVLAIIGFVLGVNNNLFTLPIVADLYHEPQFAQDAFIQSLRFYSAGPWLLLSGASRYIDAYWLYLGLLFLSNALVFAGSLLCADLIGIRTLRQRLLFTVLLAATPLLRGHSFAGDGGLFVNHFTHSEIANGLTLLLIYLLARGKLLFALAMNGVIFFDNAFIGVWDAGITLAVAVMLLWRGRLSWRGAVVQGLAGTAIAAAFSAPIIHAVLVNPDFGQPVAFDYIAFLREYWPYHFLFSSVGAIEKLDLLALAVLGIVSLWALGHGARLLLAALLVLVSLYGLGIAAPYLTHSPLVLNLHLLRIGVMLHLLAMLGALGLATRWATGHHRVLASVFAPLLWVLLCLPMKMSSVQPALMLSMAIAVIIASRFPAIPAAIAGRLPMRRLPIRSAALVLVAIGVLVVASRNAIANAQATAWVKEWRTLGAWSSDHTPRTASYLLPTWNFQGHPARFASGSVEDEAVLNSGIFESISHRSVWIDFRDGAAAMWSPSYYPLWHRRIAEINALTSYQEKLAYAKANNIGYIVDACASSGATGPVFSTGRLCLYAVSADLANR